ncbi:MAG: hypothetical protein Tsb0032_05770 [Kiloniellaceae bacterium]
MRIGRGDDVDDIGLRFPQHGFGVIVGLDTDGLCLVERKVCDGKQFAFLDALPAVIVKAAEVAGADACYLKGRGDRLHGLGLAQ